MTQLSDRDLPGLGTALSTESLIELLRTELQQVDSSVELSELQILDVRYEPGRRCEVLYRIKGVDRNGGRSVKQLLAGRLLPSGEQPVPPSTELVDRYRRDTERGLNTPWLFLEQPRLVLYAFPIDPALPWLFDALSETAVADGLGRLWEERKVRVRRVRIERLGYTPGARAAFDYQVLGESRRTGEPELRQLIGKMHAKKPAARLFAGSWALWQAARGRVDLAPPIGFVAPLNLTFQERVPGQRLGGLAGAPAFTQHARRTARALAQLHGLEFPLWTRRKPAEEAGVVLRWAAVLLAVRPDLARRIEQLRDRLVCELETRTTLKGPVHGDFHHTNVLVDGDRITIIDLDEMAFGDPLLDVGRFMASTRIPSLRTFGTVDGLHDARETFLAEYLRRNPDDERRARMFEAATLFTAAASAFRIQRPRWHEEVEILLEEAERTFGMATARGGPAVAQDLPPFKPTADPRPWLEDPLFMRATLAQDVQSTFDAELTSCTVRDVARDGERVSYRLRGRQEGRRWSTDVAGSRTRHGAGLMQRIDMLSRAMEGVPGAPVLPRPVAYVRALSLMLYEVPTGTPLASLLDTDLGDDSVMRLAHALAIMHRTATELDRTRSISSELGTLRRRTSAAHDVCPELGRRVAALASRIGPSMSAAPKWTSPVIGVVHTQHVLLDGDRITFARVEDVVLAHPFLDAADFLARLTLAGLKTGGTPDRARLSTHFRREYEARSGWSLDGAIPFEVSALLRLACTQVLRDPDAFAANRLVDHAETLLGAA